MRRPRWIWSRGAILAVLPIAADGALEPLAQLVTLDGPIGPHRV